MGTQIVHVGAFCPNRLCAHYGKVQDTKTRNIKKSGRTRAGRQRYQCKGCGQTFTETFGTLFYRRRAPEREILESLALIAEGVRISSIARGKGHKEDTILDWLEQAAAHAEAIEEVLLKAYKIERGQIDGLWSYVKNRGSKKTTRRPMKAAPSGDRP
jgi:transposase-like protein